jgi:hypothetical protein
MYLAPVGAPAVRDHDFWARNPVGFGPARDVAVNGGHRVRIEADQLLGAAGLARDRPADDYRRAVRPAARPSVSRDGMLDGIGGWFGADLADGVSMTNAPET